VAENPVRNGRLPRNIAQVARAILRAAERHGGEVPREQIDYALGLVSSGRVPRESGVQRELIDLLVEAGADPDAALVTALAHQEREAVERLLERGARPTLLAAACLGRTEEVRRLAGEASADERQAALAGAAMYGEAPALAILIEQGVDVNAFSPAGFHAHAAALHHAVSSGSLAAVRTLVDAGADLGLRDREYQGTPLDWAEYLQRAEIAVWLRAAAGEPKETELGGEEN
jgi:hypothetical protein